MIHRRFADNVFGMAPESKEAPFLWMQKRRCAHDKILGFWCTFSFSHGRIVVLIDVPNSARCPCVDRQDAGPNTVSDTSHYEEPGRPWMWQRRIPGRV